MSVSIVFKGNAGNHMFQYFTAIAFCVKNMGEWSQINPF